MLQQPFWEQAGWTCSQSLVLQHAGRSARFQASEKAAQDTPLDTSIYWCLRAAVSSLVEAGTVNDLRELSKRVHGVHRFFCLGCALSHLVRDVQSRVQGLIQGADPGEELGQSRDTSVSTMQPLPVVSQTEQGSMSVRDVDVVPVRQDLLSEGAVVSAVDVLETMGDVNM